MSTALAPPQSYSLDTPVALEATLKELIGTIEDPVKTVAKVVPDAIFCYMTALQMHGSLHNIVFVTQFYSGIQTEPFRNGRREYLPYYPNGELFEVVQKTRRGFTVSVTALEQTVFDCLRYPERAGGAENLYRSVTDLEDVNVGHLVDMVINARSPELCARLGWLLTQLRRIGSTEWLITSEDIGRLKNQIGQYDVYKMDDSSLRRPDEWDEEWRLCLRDNKDEATRWVAA